MGLEGLVETVITFTCISSVVSFALENIKGVIGTKEDHWDDSRKRQRNVGWSVCGLSDRWISDGWWWCEAGEAHQS